MNSTSLLQSIEIGWAIQKIWEKNDMKKCTKNYESMESGLNLWSILNYSSKDSPLPKPFLKPIPKPIRKLLPEPFPDPLPKPIPKPFSQPITNQFPNPSPNHCLNHSLDPFSKPIPVFIPKLFPELMEISILESGWLASNHPIPNTKFPPITAFLNRPSYHRSAEGSLCHPKWMNKINSLGRSKFVSRRTPGREISF